MTLNQITTVLVSALQILGSLGLFLYGMKAMSDGIQKAAGERMQSVLNMMTTNRVAAIFTGFAITALIQSSSATTVMVVSFVNAGLLSLTQSIGVIMGANIGTTVTAWMVSLLGFKFKISAIAVPCIGIGLPLFFSKRGRKRNWGEFLIGFGILFLGLSLLKDAIPEVTPEMVEKYVSPLTGMGFLSTILFVGAGAVLTVIVHSSSASTTITLTLAYKGMLSLPIAAAMILGGNIGTTIDAFLASIGATTNAKRAARVHILFNILGTLVILVVFKPFLKFIEYIVPGDEITTTLAMFHTVFNVTATLIFVWFVPQFAALVRKLVKSSELEHTDEPYRLEYIHTGLQDIPEINLIKARSEVKKMAEIIQGMFERFRLSLKGEKKDLEKQLSKMKKLEDYTDQMQEEISAFLLNCSKENLNDDGIVNAASLMRIVNELESIGDSCYKLMLLTQRKEEKRLPFHDSALDDIKPLEELVTNFLSAVINNFNEDPTHSIVKDANKMEKQVNEYRSELKRIARRQIQSGADVKGELLFIDLVRQIEHIGDYCMNIAEVMARMV